MRKSLRQAISALLVVAVVLALASPAIAAPRAEPAGAASLASLPSFGELLTWMGQWLQPISPDRVSAASGHAVDLVGTPTSTDSVDDPGGSVMPESHGTMDPNG
jgi:hypothetical protein